MSLVSLKKAGWFEKPLKVNFDLNEDQLKQLGNWQKIFVKDKHGICYSMHINRHANLLNLTEKDLIIENVPGSDYQQNRDASTR